MVYLDDLASRDVLRPERNVGGTSRGILLG